MTESFRKLWDNGMTVIVKRVNSAFIGTDLESRLRAAGIRTVVICGATTNHCVETTTRMAGNLGFDARLVRDATWTFDRVGPDGDKHSAEDIHAMTLANLNGEFARIVSSLATTAYSALGLLSDPAAGPRHRDLAIARQMIDWLAVLEQKTRGNLSFEESDLLSRVLYELRLAYVEVGRAPK